MLFWRGRSNAWTSFPRLNSSAGVTHAIFDEVRDCRAGDRSIPLAFRHAADQIRDEGLALLWQIYSRRCLLQIHFWQCGQRCFGGWAISSRMACRTAGKVG